MKVKSNKVKDIRNHYLSALLKSYPNEEAKKLIDILMEDLLGIKPVTIHLNPEQRLSESEMLNIHSACKDLLMHKPVQHITGQSYFYGLTLKVDKNVLIPRPETEELVEWIINDLKDSSASNLLDIGTGSGAIALAIKKNYPNIKTHACDISTKALEIAIKNADELMLDIHFFQMDILDKKNRGSFPKFGIIASNPPYVTQSDKLRMHPNVLDYEPAIALYVTDDDPLKFYKAIAQFSMEKLEPQGRIYFEINERLGAETQKLLEDMGYKNIILRKDLSDRNRFIRAQKP